MDNVKYNKKTEHYKFSKTPNGIVMINFNDGKICIEGGYVRDYTFDLCVRNSYIPRKFGTFNNKKFTGFVKDMDCFWALEFSDRPKYMLIENDTFITRLQSDYVSEQYNIFLQKYKDLFEHKKRTYFGKKFYKQKRNNLLVIIISIAIIMSILSMLF